MKYFQLLSVPPDFGSALIFSDFQDSTVCATVGETELFLSFDVFVVDVDVDPVLVFQNKDATEG